MKLFLKILAAVLALIGLFAVEHGPAFLMICVLLVSGIYMVGLIRLWRKAGIGHGLPVWRAASFLGGMIVLMFALIGPMDKLADQAFSMHMIQHMLLIKVIAPLLLLGQFSSVFLWATGQRAARQMGTAWKHSRRLRWLWQQLTRSWCAWFLFGLCLWLWHIPAFYQAALENERLHDVEHLLFLSTSLLFWWYLLQNGNNWQVRYGAIILYLFTTLLHESALGALLTFSSAHWYAFYSSPDLWGLPPLADQQLAGVIMWLPGGILLMSLIVGYFGLWLQVIEKRMVGQVNSGLTQIGERND